jgi:NitT/TauT family transport system substrate-binding protein
VWKTSGEVYPNHESVVLVFGPSMDSKQEAGRRFMVGYLRGVREHKEDGLERRDPRIVEIATQRTSIKDPELWQKMELQKANPDGYNLRASLEYDLQWFVANGFVPRAPRLDDVLDQSYVDYAISRLGRYKQGCGPNPCP